MTELEIKQTTAQIDGLVESVDRLCQALRGGYAEEYQDAVTKVLMQLGGTALLAPEHREKLNRSARALVDAIAFGAANPRAPF